MTKRRNRPRKPAVCPPAPREEATILAELRSLCKQPGFAQAVALACIRDDIIFYKDEVTAETMNPMYSRSRLIRTEIATLLGYMVQGGDVAFGSWERQPATLLEEAETLLEELHRRLSSRWFIDLPASIESGTGLAPMTGDAMREPIYYSGEAAFSFQYLDFAIPKYQGDNEWLLANRGFRIEDAVAIVRAIDARVLDGIEALGELWRTGVTDRSFPVDPFRFSAEEIATRSGLDLKIVKSVLDAFALPEGPCNFAFNALGDFNEVNARPLIRNGGRYCSFRYYALLEAIYESPFYWMCLDKAYLPKATGNRGRFAETFAYERLVLTFGKDNVWRNVNLYRAKGDRIGEIDVLVVFGGRAIVVQCKSKRLTLEARRGNDLALGKDFHGAFQHNYNQAQLCAEHLANPNVSLVTGDGDAVTFQHPISHILPLCLVSDNYPALAMQVEQFLKRREVPNVLPALFTDIFTLDAMSEMLNRPLYFLNYLELRARFGAKLSVSHEMTLLSYHLKRNLWLNDEYDFVMFDDNIAADLEIAMLARRADMPGAKTPKGILTKMVGTPFEALIRHMEQGNDPALVDLGVLLLQLSGDAAGAISQGLERVVAMTRADGGQHDVSLAFPPAGLTIHCSLEPLQQAAQRLETHVTLRKYDTKANVWYGICLHPSDGLPRFGVKVEYPWVADPQIGRAVLG